MNRFTQILIGLVAAAIAIYAGFYGRNLYLKEVSTVQIPVPIQTIPPYTLLNSDMFQLMEIPRALESLLYYLSLQELSGKISTVSLPPDLPVAQTHALQVEQFRLADAAFEVLSIPVEPVSAVGGQIHIGEQINLYQMLPDSNQDSNTDQQEKTVRRIAESVLVVDVRNAQGITASAQQEVDNDALFGNSMQSEPVQILTLAVQPAQVAVILQSLAESKKEGGYLWTTLALP